jgi:hypothetical protein
MKIYDIQQKYLETSELAANEETRTDWQNHQVDSAEWGTNVSTWRSDERQMALLRRREREDVSKGVSNHQESRIP